MTDPTDHPVTITDPAAKLRTERPSPRLVAELRQILAELDGSPAVHAIARARLHRLTEHVERLGTETVHAELDATAAGLDPEQEIRVRALEAAASWLAYLDQGSGLWELADQVAAYIRDGSRP